MKILDGIAGPRTLDRLERATPPRPHVRTRAAHAEVDLARQLLFLVRDGRVTDTLAVSTGRPGYETPAGRFSVFRKELRSWSVPYHTWMPWSAYFEGGVAFHGGAVGPRPSSHGCVHVPPPFAENVYRSLPTGTRVIVY